jgi:hypothetical protein
MTDGHDRRQPAPGTAPARLAELADLLGGESGSSRKFLGGLVIGALVGAAVAGAGAMRRRSRGRTER